MQRFIRALLIAIGSLAVLIAVAVAVAWFASSAVAAQRVALPAPVLVDVNHADLQRGRHFAEAVTACLDCHGAGLAGRKFIDNSAFGVLYAPNLTTGRGGVGGHYLDGDFERAIRRGIRPDGTRLLIMPSVDFAGLSDDDVAAIIAFIRTAPAADNDTPPIALGPVARMLLLTGKLQFDADKITALTHREPAQPAPTAEYGGYLAKVAGCMGCHGANLQGGHYMGSPDDPPATNITRDGIGTWSQDDFRKALRTGIRPDGRPIAPFMPWRVYRGMTDDELAAVYAFLRAFPTQPANPK